MGHIAHHNLQTLAFMKLVDSSYHLGIHSNKCIDARKKLLKITKSHLEGLFKGNDEDSKLFWATYSIYVIKDDGIYLCSRIGTTYPLYDVDVKKAEETRIMVKPYKIDGLDEYTVNKLNVTTDLDDEGIEQFNLISPLEVMGWKEDLKQKWEGVVWIRSNFTGWNIIECTVDKEKLIEEARLM